MTASVFIGGLVFGLIVGWVIGKAYARALRAWKDLMATKKAIKGLWQRVVGEWWVFVKVAAGFGLVFALAFTAGLLKVLR